MSFVQMYKAFGRTSMDENLSGPLMRGRRVIYAPSEYVPLCNPYALLCELKAETTTITNNMYD